MKFQKNQITNCQIDELIANSKISMNSLGILLTYSYVSRLVSLNWYDILVAIENGFLTHKSAIEHAENELEKNENSPQVVLDLAILSFDTVTFSHSIHPYIDELASQISDEERNKTKEKILYALLNWVFEHREDYVNPLKVVEIIYDDFSFPKTISSFIGYLPMEEPNLILPVLNRNRMLRKWKNYLDRQKELYSK